MNTEYYWIEGPWTGRLAIVPRPRGGDWLEGEIDSWREGGFDTMVSLLTPDEADEFDLTDEEALSEAHGIEFISFPIPDRGVPASREETSALANKLERALAAGKRVGLHCRQSIGRSSLLAACVLVAAGEDSSNAFQRISIARGHPVPDTMEQEDWVNTLVPSPAGPIPATRRL